MDIAVLLKLAKADPLVPLTQLSEALVVTPAQVQQSLRRAAAGQLVLLGPQRGRKPQEKRLNRTALTELLLHAVRYVYPAILGGETLGTRSFGKFAPTVFPAKSLEPVWPDPEGDARGLAIEPLYANAPRAARRDEQLHRALACVDALRIGQARERKWAADELRAWIKG